MPARKLLRVLVDLGFRPVSQKGSHLKLRHADGRVVVLPLHAGRDLKVGLLRGLLRDADIDVDEFLRRV